MLQWCVIDKSLADLLMVLVCAVLPEDCQLTIACHEDRDTRLPSMTTADASALVAASPAAKMISIFLAKADPDITWESLASQLQPIK